MSEWEVGHDDFGRSDDSDRVQCVGWNHRGGAATEFHLGSIYHEHDAAADDVPHFFLFVMMLMEVVGASTGTDRKRFVFGRERYGAGLNGPHNVGGETGPKVG